jgi:hypothetical protein
MLTCCRLFGIGSDIKTNSRFIGITMSDEKVARDYTPLLALDDEGKMKALQMFVEFLQRADRTPDENMFDLAEDAFALTDDTARAFGIEEKE